jgi:hypothetical protein
MEPRLLPIPWRFQPTSALDGNAYADHSADVDTHANALVVADTLCR